MENVLEPERVIRSDHRGRWDLGVGGGRVNVLCVGGVGGGGSIRANIGKDWQPFEIVGR